VSEDDNVTAQALLKLR